MYIFKKLNCLTFGVCCSLALLFSSTASAVSPEIEAQQKQLRTEQTVWSTVKLPQGIDIQSKTSNTRSSGYDQVSLYGENLLFSYVEDLKFDIKTLSAILTPTKKDIPVILNDVSTFKIEVKSGDLLLGFKTLEYIFNRHVLNYAERPLRNVKVSSEGNEIVIDTEMQLKSPYPSMWIGTRIKGTVRLDEQQRISIDVTSLEAYKLPLAWAMHLMKLDLDYFITLDRQGIELVDRSIKIDLSVLPPPQLLGNLTQAKIESDGVRLNFASDDKLVFDKPPIQSNSYLWLQSGDVRIADMVILNGHMQALSADPKQRVLFNLYQCRDQIAKGSLRLTDKGEVIAYLPSTF